MVLGQRRQKILKAKGRRRFWKDSRQGDETQLMAGVMEARPRQLWVLVKCCGGGCISSTKSSSRFSFSKSEHL